MGEKREFLVQTFSSYSLFNLFKVFNHAAFSLEKKLQLFDSLVGSILNFGSQVWGYHNAPDIENVHTRFLKRLMNVKIINKFKRPVRRTCSLAVTCN